jgi:hypothetical protein
MSVLLAVLSAMTVTTASNKGHNVLMFAVDDLRAQFGESYNMSWVKTPHMDGLASRPGATVMVSLCSCGANSALAQYAPQGEEHPAARPPPTYIAMFGLRQQPTLIVELCLGCLARCCVLWWCLTSSANFLSSAFFRLVLPC